MKSIIIGLPCLHQKPLKTLKPNLNYENNQSFWKKVSIINRVPATNRWLTLLNIYEKKSVKPMVCYCLPIVWGCGTNPEVLQKTDGLPEPVSNLLCPRCGHKGNSKYMTHKAYCSVCFCFSCPCGNSEPFMACGKCNYDFSHSQIQRCKQCKLGSTFTAPYCSECGTKQ